MSGAQFVGIEAEAIARWGEPSFRTRREWRWGRRGSLALSVSGKKRGLWYDHESGQGGRLGSDGDVQPSAPRPKVSQATDPTDEPANRQSPRALGRLGTDRVDPCEPISRRDARHSDAVDRR
jgi:hypothetical protein